MDIATLESIVGPINRGKLESGFPTFHDQSADEVPAFFSDDRTMAKPPPLTEDFSHLNGRSTARFSELAKRVWKNMTPEQRKKRKEHLRRAGLVGGHATKDMRHLYGS